MKTQTSVTQPMVRERSAEFGAISGLAETFPKEKSLELFRRMALVRAFELGVKRAVEGKYIGIYIYLAVGQEAIPAALSMVMQGSWMVPQHRAHGIGLLFGMDPAKIIDELLGLPTGCCKGMGGSPSIHDLSKKIVGHNHLIGDNVPVAAGMAYANPKEKFVCMFGDGAAEEDYVLGALGFAATHKLPILFVCDDNDLSVLTPTKDRRTWKIADVARGFGMPAVDVSDDPWVLEHHMRQFSSRLPALINVRTCRELWHNGVGTDGPPEWNRYQLVKDQLNRLGLGAEVPVIERQAEQDMDRIWNERLQKLSETSRAST